MKQKNLKTGAWPVHAGSRHRRKERKVIDDGCHSELVENAVFEGILEIPCIPPQKEMVIPRALIPFSQRNRSRDFSEYLVFYEKDVNFADFLRDPAAFADDLLRFPGMISPDCSLYRDMPLCLQVVNTYWNRAVGHFFRKLGMDVIPNVRWGDERSFAADTLPEKFAFLGVPKNGIVAVGTYGCIRGRENKDWFRAGLAAMLETLTPRIVLVYGAMPESVFGPFAGSARFIRYPDWIRSRKGGR